MIRTLLALFAARKPPDLVARFQVLARGERGRDWGSA
jgi:hypothetical protein